MYWKFFEKRKAFEILSSKSEFRLNFLSHEDKGNTLTSMSVGVGTVTYLMWWVFGDTLIFR